MIGANVTSDFSGMKAFKAFYKREMQATLSDEGKELLQKSAFGSSEVPFKASLDMGPLRASGQVFLDKKFLAQSAYPATYDKYSEPFIRGSVDIADEYKLTIAYNSPYAERIHELKLNPGAESVRDGYSNPGIQWLYKHLRGDYPQFLKNLGNSMRRKWK